ncbi:TPA: hypothetical protein ACF0M1_002365 [Enterococcus hirae]|uniref:Replication-associated protein RepC n=2 Tax=Enterococcus hirae TaxID=1354 RepID=G0YP59_ENTHA|nr:hypothetical protein [Enterococcus hirae]AEJ87179.1 hypothetical protein EHR_3016 [Enterococcus hirae ATCC 9790]EOH66626.1 hypothetical protein UAE_02771 [Enterococcus hirae ATCC 9790]EOU03345.1 hypothetical protein I584_02718 [Enterococcus hirae ATCC 9790]OJG49213.1 hypothetical protein RV05_GL001343 [Enterococcus hirae]QQY20818.1 hypothetical protein I6I80_00275 [Enterococcus hirae]
MTDTNKKRPTGLIKNTKITPNQSADSVQAVKKQTRKAKNPVVKNQDANIKVSRQTKDQIDILMKLTDNKFSYEMIESMIDHYVETSLDADKKRAFKTLSNL